MLAHILERFFLHVAGGFLLVGPTFFLLTWLWPRVVKWPLNSKPKIWLFFGLCGLPAILWPPLREAFDVAAGQPVVKAVTDYISWYVSAAAWTYGFYRLTFKIKELF